MTTRHDHEHEDPSVHSFTPDDLAGAVELTVPAVPDDGHNGQPWTTRPLPERRYEALLHRTPGRPVPITLDLASERWWNITTLNA
ncbi:hypothetical protein [Kitasatospora sp. NPDC005856]|uniref:hypothetical protein n=1 Tax=Kitasatospora sp. NPDC005856 TaxID=3154566 RepID=UPI0033F826AD